MKKIALHKLFFFNRNILKAIGNHLQNRSVKTWEPKIKKNNRNGSFYFKVYDPVSNKTFYTTSEKEVRVWLERRYYQ